MKMKRLPKLQPGYAYGYDGYEWKYTKDDNWEIVMVSDARGAEFVGYRNIDGVPHAVFRKSGRYLAQNRAFTGGKRRHSKQRKRRHMYPRHPQAVKLHRRKPVKRSSTKRRGQSLSGLARAVQELL